MYSLWAYKVYNTHLYKIVVSGFIGFPEFLAVFGFEILGGVAFFGFVYGNISAVLLLYSFHQFESFWEVI